MTYILQGNEFVLKPKPKYKTTYRHCKKTTRVYFFEWRHTLAQRDNRRRGHMADRIRVSDLDFVYISYAEPNKEQNWADLKNKVPWAKRVDGVKGFDSAHKAAAETGRDRFLHKCGWG